MKLQALPYYLLLLSAGSIWWNCSENPADVSGTSVGTENILEAEVEIKREDFIGGPLCPVKPDTIPQMSINVRPADLLPGSLGLPDRSVQVITLDSIGAFNLVLKSGKVFFLEIEVEVDLGCGATTWLGWLGSLEANEDRDTLDLGNILLRYPGGQVNGKFSFASKPGETVYTGFPGTEHILELTSDVPFSFPQVPAGSWGLQIIRWSEPMGVPVQIILLSDIQVVNGAAVTLESINIDSLGTESCAIQVLPDGTMQRTGGVIKCLP